MSSEDNRIPRHAKAGVAFLGVELNDALILIASIFIGLFAGRVYGTGAYLGVPAAGYWLNKQYVQWRSGTLPGQFKAWLFRMGIRGYNGPFSSNKVIFAGDSTVTNPSSRKMVKQIIKETQTANSDSVKEA